MLTTDANGTSQLRTAGFNFGPNSQQAGHTVRGAGGVTTFDFDNSGTFRADQSGKTLSVNANAGSPVGLVNNGLLEAINGGTLQVSGKYGVSTTGVVRANGGTVYGSSLPTNYAAGTLTSGTYDVRANSTLRLDGATVVTNNAAIILDGANSAFTNDAGGTSALAGLAANGGSLTIRNGRNLSTGPLTNSGVLTVGDNSVLSVGGGRSRTPARSPAPARSRPRRSTPAASSPPARRPAS